MSSAEAADSAGAAEREVAHDRRPGFRIVDPSPLQRSSEDADTRSLTLATAWVIAGTHLGIGALAALLSQPLAVALHGLAGLAACGFAWAIARGAPIPKLRVPGVATILAGMCVFLFVYPGPHAVFAYVVAPFPAFRILGLRAGSWATAGFLGIAVVCLSWLPMSAELLPLGVRVNTLIGFVIAAAFGYRFERSRNRTSAELTAALEQVRVLRGLVPICVVCKKVRDGETWRPDESVLRTKGQLGFSHSYCEECVAQGDDLRP